MPAFLSLILPLVIKLIEWLIERQRQDKPISEKVKRRLGTLIAKTEELRAEAYSLGCCDFTVDENEETEMLQEAANGVINFDAI